MEDDALMRQTAGGDQHAFAQIVARHQADVTRFAARLLRDGEAARDVAQETFLRVWRARHQYRAEGKFRLYLLRIAHNVCRDQARARTVGEESLDAWQEQGREWEAPPTANTSRLAEGRLLFQDVQTALAALPHAQKVVFVLSCGEGLSYKEIADVLECPVGTVASRKALALETLRRRLYHWAEAAGDSRE